MDLSEISPSDLANLTEQGYTDSDLEMLAESEVKALLIDGNDGDAGGSSSTDPHDRAATEQDDTAAVAAAAAAALVEEEAAEAAAAAVAAEKAPFIPEYKAEMPADAAQQIKALRTEVAASFKKLMDGEIDADTYQAVQDRVDAEVDTLRTQALTASVFQQANEQAQAQAARKEWDKAETAAFNGFKAEGLDYKGKPSLLAAYNTNLKTLGADPKNENRDAAWFLAEANRLTREDLGMGPVASAKKPAPTARAGVDLSELPPTLRSVPVAATSAVNTDEFAHMRNLEGLALERAHAGLTESQRDRWMAE
jgi:hypothetical protein